MKARNVCIVVLMLLTFSGFTQEKGKWRLGVDFGIAQPNGKFEKLPYNGTNYTFTHSSHLGVEYTTKNDAKLRLSYGQFHQSNNDWWEVNPSHNANGFNFTYLWRINPK